ncbi:MAG: TetR/AcrR family transcriptional regulator [Archangium sp.]
MSGPRSADDWVKMGFELLSSRGADAVRVEPLARALRVTKGSFYWHFADRAALLKAMLAGWERRATSQIIEWVDEGGGRPAERLARLMQLTGANPQAPAIEQAIRAWGTSDKRVRTALRRVDARREAYVERLLVEHGLPRALAKARTRVIYLALIGEFAVVSHGGQPSPRTVWSELVGLALRR